MGVRVTLVRGPRGVSGSCSPMAPPAVGPAGTGGASGAGSGAGSSDGVLLRVGSVALVGDVALVVGDVAVDVGVALEGITTDDVRMVGFRRTSSCSLNVALVRSSTDATTKATSAVMISPTR